MASEPNILGSARRRGRAGHVKTFSGACDRACGARCAGRADRLLAMAAPTAQDRFRFRRRLPLVRGRPVVARQAPRAPRRRGPGRAAFRAVRAQSVDAARGRGRGRIHRAQVRPAARAAGADPRGPARARRSGRLRVRRAAAHLEHLRRAPPALLGRRCSPAPGRRRSSTRCSPRTTGAPRTRARARCCCALAAEAGLDVERAARDPRFRRIRRRGARARAPLAGARHQLGAGGDRSTAAT